MASTCVNFIHVFLMQLWRPAIGSSFSIRKDTQHVSSILAYGGSL